ncbi:unnamed protein product [Choristocarpus tenellus]
MSFVPSQLALLAYACYTVNKMELSNLEYIGFTLSVGIYTGGVGITVSHELVHKNTRVEQWAGRLVCVAMGYGHFYVEHTRGHHKMVGTDNDPATARFGESFYSFLPRCIVGSFCNAWRLEVDRCREMDLTFWHNEMLWYWTASSFLCGGLVAAFGRWSVPLFLGQSAMGVLLFESVNYLEHYGLERRRLEDGRYEQVGYEHSWDSPHRLTNMVLFKLQRHADHHVNSTKRYQTLRAELCSPQLPMGYPTCVLLALCPPLWRTVIDPRVLAIRSKHEGRVWRHGPEG